MGAGYGQAGKTSLTPEIAALVGVHPNSVRFYGEQGLLPPIPRQQNGCRIYSQHHPIQLRLIQTAFWAEILCAYLRHEATEIVKTSAAGALESAAYKIHVYRIHLGEEIGRAREAIALTEQLLDGTATNAA